MLFSRESLAEDAHVSTKGLGVSGITPAYNGKLGREVDEVIATVEALGATIDQDPTESILRRIQQLLQRSKWTSILSSLQSVF